LLLHSHHQQFHVDYLHQVTDMASTGLRASLSVIFDAWHAAVTATTTAVAARRLSLLLTSLADFHSCFVHLQIE
jgi:hypothetical protein